MVAQHRVSEAAEFTILRGWVCAVIPKRARAVLDARAVTNAAELEDALQDHLILDGERTEGQAAIFKKASGEVSRERECQSLRAISVASRATRHMSIGLGRVILTRPGQQ